MSFSHTGNNGTTSDTAAREFNNNEHNETVKIGAAGEGDRWAFREQLRPDDGGQPRGRQPWRRHSPGDGEYRGRGFGGGRGGYRGGHRSRGNRGSRGGGGGFRGSGFGFENRVEQQHQPEEPFTAPAAVEGEQPARGGGGLSQRGRFDIDFYDRSRRRGRGRPYGGGRGARENEGGVGCGSGEVDLQGRKHQDAQNLECQVQDQQQQHPWSEPAKEKEQVPATSQKPHWQPGGKVEAKPDTYPKMDPISTNPNRTQRGPRFRKNCHDEREIEKLFESHHQQKGISLENYASIPVDIVPRDIDAVESFEDLFVEPALALNIAKCGYKEPTPVQRYGIPVCLNGNDLMACAQTGSGKTAAFLVPVVHYILKHGVSPAKDRMSHPIAVIMAPTRELALQIYDEVRKLTFRTDIFYDVAYGGTPYPSRFENDILVACPGRLKDIFDRNYLSFSCVKFLILDEADRMLEMGFEEQIEYLVASRYTDMPSTDHRQTLMFSATFPQRILNLAKRYLRPKYYLLTVGRVGSTTKNITQKIERVTEAEKMQKLLEIIFKQKQTDLVLIFVETKRLADQLHNALRSNNIPSATIHGDRRQSERENALRDFKSGVTPILVATDVASRGLDIPNVAHVIQYDLPKEMDDYTHRIGRTGRAGNKGVATSFYDRNNRNLAAELYHYLREHEQEVPMWLEDEKDAVEGERLLGPTRGGNRRGGGETRRAPQLSNSTWGEAAAARGGPRGARGQPAAKESFIDDGGF